MCFFHRYPSISHRHAKNDSVSTSDLMPHSEKRLSPLRAQEMLPCTPAVSAIKASLASMRWLVICSPDSTVLGPSKEDLNSFVIFVANNLINKSSLRFFLIK